MLGRDHARKNTQPARRDNVIVVTLAERAQFGHAQTPARGAEVWRELFHVDHAMRQAQNVGIDSRPGLVHLVVEQQDGAVQFRELLLQTQKLRRYRKAVSAIRRNSESESKA